MTGSPAVPDQLLHDRLMRALREDRLQVHYQPIVRLPDGEVVGYEALCRWTDTELGPVPPATFIAVAEADGLICELGDWVLRQAIDAAIAWGRPELTVAVNVAARQLSDDALVATVAEELRRSGLAAERLTLEITETAAMVNNESAIGNLRALRGLGVRIALDDFGTGYSSLTMLQQLPVDVVKVDRSFVARVHSDTRDAVLVRLVIDAAHSAGALACAEGVETPEQAQQLMAMGCDLVQGWLFGMAEADVVPASGHDALVTEDVRAGAAGMPWAGGQELIVVSDPVGVIRFVSMSARQVLGWSPGELVGRPVEKLLVASDTAEDVVPVVGPRVHRVLHRDGQVRWLEATSRRLLDEEGTVKEILTVARDVTATVRARAAADDVEALFRNAFDRAPTGMAITDLQGRFLRVNQAFASLLGRRAEEVRRTTIESLTHPDDRATDAANLAQLERGEEDRHDVVKRYLHQDGSAVICHVRAVLARDHARPEGYIVAHVYPVRDRPADIAR